MGESVEVGVANSLVEISGPKSFNSNDVGEKSDTTLWKRSISQVDGGDVEVPKVGMLFESYEDACEFYEGYAKRTGFGAIRTRTNLGDKGQKVSFTLACSKSGKPKYKDSNHSRKKPSIKTDCMARIQTRLRNDGLYCLTVVELDHNHEFSPSDELYTPTKRLGDLNGRLGNKVGKTHSSLATESGGSENMHSGEKDCRNHVTKQRGLRLGEGDVEALLSYFRRMQKRNFDFFHIMEVDENNRISNVFWAEARCRAAYESFSDVVIFDTTYLMNKYDVPLATFVGINHHGQSILLGCGLLSDETIETYIWLFQVWLECMSGVAPKALIIDQCKAIQNAAAHVFPKSHYRFCLGHIMRKILEKLVRYAGYEEIRSILHMIVYDSLRVDDFEMKWETMVEEYDLEDNEWLKNLYEDRYRWVPVYVKDTFWAGISSSQRSESMDSFFDDYVHSKTSLKQFVEQYDMAMLRKIKNERDEDFRSCKSSIPRITELLMEKQAQKVYTNRIFKIFQDEIKNLIFCSSVALTGKDGTMLTFGVKDNSKRFDEHGKSKDQVSYEVTLDSQTLIVQCICRLFEFQGILCRHALCVLMDQRIDILPDKYILLRWRKDVKRPHTDIKIFCDEFESNEEISRYNKLYSRLSRIARIGAKSEGLCNSAMTYLDEVEEKILSDDTLNVQCINIEVEGDRTEQNVELLHTCADSKVHSPLQVSRKESPCSKGKESIVEKTNKRKAKTNVSDASSVNFDDSIGTYQLADIGIPENTILISFNKYSTM